MDLNAVYQRIPRNPCLWSMEDTANWLSFIGCEKYIQNFENQCFDGTLWNELDDETLNNDFGIKQRIARVKLLKWVGLFRTQFNEQERDGVTQLFPIQILQPAFIAPHRFIGTPTQGFKSSSFISNQQ